MRNVMRRRHYSIRTERAYCDWVKRYVLYFKMKSRDGLCDGEKKIETFLTFLARDKNVAPSTQNQALNALVFLYKYVIKQPLDDKINAERATMKVKIPLAFSEAEITIKGEKLEPDDFDALSEYSALFKKQYERKIKFEARTLPNPESIETE